MKRILFSVMLTAVATIVFAQEKQLQVWHNGNITHAIDVSQIDSINFGELIPEIEMITVEGGTFTMGETGIAEPAHEVTLSSFAIGKYEVTQELWYAVMESYPAEPTEQYGLGDNYPVYYVSWNDIQEFIAKLNELTGKTYRLPTEAEWEFAARGGNLSEGYTFSGSNNVDEVAWSSENSGSTNHEVGTKLPNELGIYDMTGNAWEWVFDWYAPYNSDPQTNPQGPETGSYRVLRGGSWRNNALNCRVVNRGYYSLNFHDSNCGFRLVLSN